MAFEKGKSSVKVLYADLSCDENQIYTIQYQLKDYEFEIELNTDKNEIEISCSHEYGSSSTVAYAHVNEYMNESLISSLYNHANENYDISELFIDCLSLPMLNRDLVRHCGI